MKTLINHSIARSVAESLWGTGGTRAVKTNRKGTYYFSCSGHGGWVVDADALTPEEKKAIQPYSEPYYGTMHVFKGWDGKTKKKLSWQGQRGAFKTTYHADKVAKTIHVFEEDCAWAILHLLTGLRLRDERVSEEELTKQAEKIFRHFYKKSA